MKRFSMAVGLLALVVSAALAADGLEAKLDEILARHRDGADAPMEVEIREDEANAYIRDVRLNELPDGVESPWVQFEENVTIVGATLDLDELEGQLPDSAIFSLLSGRVPVEVVAHIQAAAGIGKLVLQRVTLSGVDLPPDMVAALIAEQDMSEYLPPGFRLGQAFTLPFDLESIQCQPGTVKVRQRATARTQ